MNHQTSLVSNVSQLFNLKIGPYEIYPIPTGQFGLDGGAMFGTVPKVLWEKSNPPDPLNRIQMEARALLLKSKESNILIDTGNGADFIEKYGPKIGPKFAQMYDVDQSGPSLIKSLNACGLSEEDIDFVILTHLHFDHAGGATSSIQNEIKPTFPRATYFIQQSNLDTALNPNIRERASYFQVNFEPLIKYKALKILEGPTNNILPGVSLFTSDGHTLGQQLVKISDESTTLIYCGDLIPTSSHVRLPWIMGYDLNPLQLIAEKEKLLLEAAEKNWILFFEHDPYCDCAEIEKNQNDFAVKKKYFLKRQAE